MLLQGVHTSVAAEAHQVQSPARACVVHQIEQQRILINFTRRDHEIDTRDIHVHDASGADIQVPNFAVPHLAFR